MLASRMIQLLPPLSYDEALEVAAIHSVAGHDIHPKNFTLVLIERLIILAQLSLLSVVVASLNLERSHWLTEGTFSR